MNKKIILLAIIVLILAAAGYVAYNAISTPAAPEEGEEEQAQEEIQVLTGEGEDNVLIKDEFTILQPVGWLQANPPEGVSAMVVNYNEGENEYGLNFKTYFAVSHDVLEESTMEEYVQLFKSEIASIDGSAVFSGDNSVNINGRNAQAFEIGMNQMNINFKILVVMVEGRDNDIWTISFNTFASNWDNYQGLFSDITNSFKLK